MTDSKTAGDIMRLLACFWMPVLISVVLATKPQTLHASTNQVSGLCDAAAFAASQQTGVPLQVMQAITRVETGRALPDSTGLQPWPWAINQGGNGAWFNTEGEARAFAEIAVAQGSRNIDIGCFQLNHRWHAKGFPSLEAMFDPLQNALYAARYLQEKYQETGDWSLAAGAYHSATPEFSDRYQSRFDEILSDLMPFQQADATGMHQSNPLQQEPSINQFPLLVTGSLGARGSLVPIVQGRRPLFGAP